ncbi:MAG: MotA/TolQ/ExbB proton channel family protein [Bacteroidota bacterium]
MIELFYTGGILFMGLLSLVFLVILVLVFFNFLLIQRGQGSGEKIALIRSLGLFALVLGIFGQLIGLYDAFKAIQEWGEVAPGLLAQGFRVSMIPTLYGALIFLLAYLASFGLHYLMLFPREK